MKTLHLTLKKKWFDMIASGEKKEEYRDVKPYWVKRLTNKNCHSLGELELIAALTKKESFRNDFDVIIFKNGYAKDSPQVVVRFINIHWGFPKNHKWFDGNCEKWLFCIELGEILSGTTTGGATTVENFSHK